MLGVATVGLSEFFKDVVRAVRLTQKPDKEEFKLTLRVVLIGMSIIGVLGFVFKMIGSAFQFSAGKPLPPESGLAALFISMIVVLGFLFYIYRKYRV